MNFMLQFLLITPVLACLAIIIGAPAKRTALFSSLIGLISTVALAWGFDAEAEAFQFITKIPVAEHQDLFTLHFHLGIDGMSLAMLLLTSVVTLSAVCISPEDIKRGKLFYICLLLVSLGAVGAFVSLDLFFLYAFHAVALIPTFLLIGIWGTHDRKFAATQMTIYLMAGSLVLLAGLLAFYFYLPEPTFDLVEIQEMLQGDSFTAEQQSVIYPLLLIGFGILIALFPFHSWAPRGYATSPAACVMLHAGVLKQFGFYGLIRLAVPYLPDGIAQYLPLLLVLLLCNLIYIGFLTLTQKDLNLMLAFSSVMHMGYLFLGLAGMNAVSINGMVLLMVAHGLSTALLFGLAAEIRERAGTLHFAELGGMASKAPWLAFLFIAGGMASMGLPGLGNFAGEVMIYFGAWKGAEHHPILYIVIILAAWGLVISAIYMLRAIKTVCYGSLSDSLRETEDFKDFAQAFPFLLLLAGLLLTGLCPWILSNWMKPVLVGLGLE
ncbi:MAG: NADH-quinone oxidoreductase subunit M [Verrucomicrobiota bacterium]